MTDTVILRRESVIQLIRGNTTPVVTNLERSVVVIKRDGVPGRKGDPGNPGPPGNGSQVTYTYNAPDVMAIWNISHNLGRYPSVTVVDNGGEVVLPEVTYLDDNLLRVEFDRPMLGSAFLN